MGLFTGCNQPRVFLDLLSAPGPSQPPALPSAYFCRFTTQNAHTSSSLMPAPPIFSHTHTHTHTHNIHTYPHTHTHTHKHRY